MAVEINRNLVSLNWIILIIAGVAPLADRYLFFFSHVAGNKHFDYSVFRKALIKYAKIDKRFGR